MLGLAADRRHAAASLVLTVILVHARYDEWMKFQVEAYIWVVSAVAANVTVTAALTWTLVSPVRFTCARLLTCVVQLRRKTGFQASDDVVNRAVLRACHRVHGRAHLTLC